MPTEGEALNTSFELRAMGWTVDADQLPLTYTFLVATAGPSVANLTLTRGNALFSDTLLPAGSGPQSLLGLVVLVTDDVGSQSSRSLDVPVYPRPLDYAQLGDVVAEQTAVKFRGGDMVAVRAILGFAAATLAQTAATTAADLATRQAFRRSSTS